MSAATGRGLAMGGLAVGGLIAGVALPRLIKAGRRSLLTIGGMTYRTAPVGGARPIADPARGRPA